jgi:hypothetical protein
MPFPPSGKTMSRRATGEATTRFPGRSARSTVPWKPFITGSSTSNPHLAPYLEKAFRALDRHVYGRLLADWMEGIPKRRLLDCLMCGDCGIQHVAFLCPESQCPKHLRNGACGGSRDAMCEVYPDRKCVWFRAYQRWASTGRLNEMSSSCVAPRMWELDRTSSWINFHLKRDHQTSARFTEWCPSDGCPMAGGPGKREEL